MTHTFDPKVSLHSWLLWPIVWRGMKKAALKKCSAPCTRHAKPPNEANNKETSLPLTVTLIVLVIAERTPFCAVQVYDPWADLSTEEMSNVPLGN